MIFTSNDWAAVALTLQLATATTLILLLVSLSAHSQHILLEAEQFADPGGEAVKDRRFGGARGRLREAGKRPDHHGHGEDRRARPLEEGRGPGEKPDQHRARLRDLVIGQIKHEGRRGLAAREN